MRRASGIDLRQRYGWSSEYGHPIDLQQSEAVAMAFSMRIVSTAARFGACFAEVVMFRALSGYSYGSAATSSCSDSNVARRTGFAAYEPQTQLGSHGGACKMPRLGLAAALTPYARVSQFCPRGGRLANAPVFRPIQSAFSTGKETS